MDDDKVRPRSRRVKRERRKPTTDANADFTRAVNPELDAALAALDGLDGSDVFALDSALKSLAAAEAQSGVSPAAVRTHAAEKLWSKFPRRDVERMLDEVFPKKGASSSSSSSTAQQQRAQKDRILDRALDVMTLFHDAGGRSYASVKLGGHVETWPVRSRDCRLYLRKLYHEAADGKQAPSAQAITDALETLDSRAHFDGEQHDVHVRVASTGTAIYLDLADDAWRCVEITATGWRICDTPPVKFRRARGMLALPVPERGGTIDELKSLVNAADDNWTLLVTWLAAALRGTGPFPVLAVHGQQGSAKSTLCRVARMLIDPNMAPIRAAPREPRDLMIAANNGWLVAFDNLSAVPPWLSDALCRLSTGGGFSVRSLYTDDDEVIFDAQRPVVVNGIEELADRGDLLDRCAILTLPVIAEEDRRAEADFWPAFRLAHPRLLGALLDATSTALASVHTVTLPKLPRMADFAIWATAAAPGLGLSKKQFLTAYEANRKNAVAIELEAASITEPLLAFLQADELDEEGKVRRKANEEWEGTCGDLLKVLNAKVDDHTRRRDGWPKSPQGMSGILRRLAPSLAATGTEIQFPSRKHGGVRRIRITSSPSSPQEKPTESKDFSGDDQGDDHSSGGDTSSPGDDGSDTTETSSPTSSPTQPTENNENGDDGDDGDDGEPTLSTFVPFNDDARELDEDA